MGKLVVFTGAGLSAESGIATFRTGDNNLWANHSIDVVCNISTWKDNFDAVHAFYNERRLQIESAQPNAAHYEIAAWQKAHPCVLLTQNIDDLLERAGCTNVVHLHGSILDMHCRACGTRFAIGYRAWNPVEDRCKCGSRKGVKPGVVFFGEDAPLYTKLYDVLNALASDDVVVVCGTSGNVIRIGTYLNALPGHKLLNNLEPSPSVIDRENDEDTYQEILYESAVTALPSFTQVIANYLA